MAKPKTPDAEPPAEGVETPVALDPQEEAEAKAAAEAALADREKEIKGLRARLGEQERKLQALEERFEKQGSPAIGAQMQKTEVAIEATSEKIAVLEETQTRRKALFEDQFGGIFA